MKVVEGERANHQLRRNLDSAQQLVIYNLEPENPYKVCNLHTAGKSLNDLYLRERRRLAVIGMPSQSRTFGTGWFDR